MNVNHVYCGDALEIMKNFPPNSIDSLVGDGPYGWGFMNLSYDKFTPKGYQDFSFKWGSQALRVLKPGAYNLSFSAPKKYHRMACGLEDAGFKIKDCLMWLFSQGISTSLNISLEINRLLGGEIKRGKMLVAPDGQSYDKRKKIGKPLTDYCYGGDIIAEEDLYEKIPTDLTALKWIGWGTDPMSAYEPIVMAQKPREGTYAENILKWGVGGINIDNCRIKYNKVKEVDSRIYTPEKNITRGTHKNATIKYAPDGNEFPMYKTQKGRWPKNVILTHHPECIFNGHKKVGSGKFKHNSEIQRKGIGNNGPFNKSSCGFDVNKGQGLGNFGEEIVKSYLCHPNCPVKLIDFQSGITTTGDIKPYYSQVKNPSCQFRKEFFHYNSHKGDKGGASRFFYSAKAYVKERNAGCEDLYWERVNGDFKRITQKEYDLLNDDDRAYGNPIRTLKPINLMRYLVRLVTPPGGTVLDPFGGSGTTGIACIIEGFNYILIEKRKTFAEIIIPKRLEYWKDPNNWKLLKDHPLLPEIELKINQQQNVSLDTWIKEE